MPDQERQPSISHSLAVSMTAKEKNWALFTLGLVLFTHIVDFMVLMPLGPQLFRNLNITPKHFSTLISVYSFAAGIFSFLGSLIFDRVDRKKALLTAYCGFLVGTLSCALSETYSSLLVARTLAGAFGGVLSAISFAIVADLFLMEERGTANGKLMTAYSLATVIGIPFGLLLSNSLQWQAPFFAIVFLGVAVVFSILFNIPTVRPHGASVNFTKKVEAVFSGVTKNLTDLNSLQALTLTLFMAMSQYIVIPFISPYLVLNVGYPEKHLWLVYLLGGLFTAFTGPLMGKFCDRFKAQWVFSRTGLLFLIPIFFITHMGQAGMIVTLFATTSFFVFSNTRLVPAMTIITSCVPPERRGSYMSLNSSLQQMGSATASLLGGFVVSLVERVEYSEHSVHTHTAQSLTQHLNQLTGFADTAYLAIFFGLLAYWVGRRVKMVS